MYAGILTRPLTKCKISSFLHLFLPVVLSVYSLNITGTMAKTVKECFVKQTQGMDKKQLILDQEAIKHRPMPTARTASLASILH